MWPAAFDFIAERGFIEASVDPREILDWMTDYSRRGREAAAEGDDAAAAAFDELHREAEDRVVDLKAAALRPPKSARADADEGAPRAVRPERVVPGPLAAPAAPAAQTVRARMVDLDEAARRESARRRAEEQAAARAADEAAQADRDREDQEELRQLQERAAKAKARRDAALAATARTEAAAKRTAAEAERARRDEAMRRAAQNAEDEERAAAEAEAAARSAATMARKATGPVGPVTAPPRAPANRPGDRGSAAPPAAPLAEFTPLGMLFHEQLADLAAKPANQPLPVGQGVPGPMAPTSGRAAEVPAVQPAPARVAAARAQPATPKLPPPAPPPADPLDDLPSLTGADLTSFRNWLAVSQRALAAKLGVEQSTISKGEGKPTTVLPPQLRKALHQAMGEPRADAGSAL